MFSVGIQTPWRSLYDCSEASHPALHAGDITDTPVIWDSSSGNITDRPVNHDSVGVTDTHVNHDSFAGNVTLARKPRSFCWCH